MLAGAMPIGGQYLFTLDQLAALVALTGGCGGLLALHDRIEAQGIKIVLRVG